VTTERHRQRRTPRKRRSTGFLAAIAYTYVGPCAGLVGWITGRLMVAGLGHFPARRPTDDREYPRGHPSDPDEDLALIPRCATLSTTTVIRYRAASSR
jgi:hypothetical protein